MSELKKILDLFGLEFHNCKFNGKEPPKLALVVNPTSNTVEKVKSEFLGLPAVAFQVSVITAKEYLRIICNNVDDADDTDNKNAWMYFECSGCCTYNHNNNTVYIGYPYPYNESDPYGGDVNLPIERAILHELGHYKQQMIHEVSFVGGDNDNNIALEYHNIMFNENVSKIPLATDNNWEYNGHRIAYHKDTAVKQQLTLEDFKTYLTNHGAIEQKNGTLQTEKKDFTRLLVEMYNRVQ